MPSAEQALFHYLNDALRQKLAQEISIDELSQMVAELQEGGGVPNEKYVTDLMRLRAQTGIRETNSRNEVFYIATLLVAGAAAVLRSYLNSCIFSDFEESGDLDAVTPLNLQPLPPDLSSALTTLRKNQAGVARLQARTPDDPRLAQFLPTVRQQERAVVASFVTDYLRPQLAPQLREFMSQLLSNSDVLLQRFAQAPPVEQAWQAFDATQGELHTLLNSKPPLDITSIQAATHALITDYLTVVLSQLAHPTQAELPPDPELARANQTLSGNLTKFQERHATLSAEKRAQFTTVLTQQISDYLLASLEYLPTVLLDLATVVTTVSDQKTS